MERMEVDLHFNVLVILATRDAVEIVRSDLNHLERCRSGRKRGLRRVGACPDLDSEAGPSGGRIRRVGRYVHVLPDEG